MQAILPTENQEIFTVSRLNQAVKYIMESSFSTVWVEGEVSNFAAPNSGHWYFSLKDPSAQVRCAAFRAAQRKFNFTLKDGMHVLVKARVSLYENRGEFQLIIEDIEERGEGKLRRAFELLKKKLEAEGLFDPLHKKPLPHFPQQIGVITSPTGAAIRDILTVLKRRYPSVSVIIYPALVQGEGAAPAIVKAIHLANERRECDVLILSRGGGSLEDLWCFNEETVALAIYKSQIPLISGVGHEIDFTIADFVADVRAPTPSAAAEIVTPDQAELLSLLTRHHQHLSQQIKNKANALKQQMEWTFKHLQQHHPKRKLREQMQSLDYYELTFLQIQTKQINKLTTKLAELDAKLHRLDPIHHIVKWQHQLNLYNQELNNLIGQQFNQHQVKLGTIAAKLETLSPLSTLNRGYAIASDKNHHVLRDTKNLKKGDKVEIRLLEGSLDCSVEKINN
jgi:exodeoxyribonuclease VII large subunit